MSGTARARFIIKDCVITSKGAFRGRYLATLGSFLILVSCTDNGVGVYSAVLDQEFTLQLGHSVTVEGENLLLTFTDVPEDSRCPQDVMCVWEGNGRVAMKIDNPVLGTKVFSLNTTLQPKKFPYLQYEVELKGLSPYPRSDYHIRKRDYVATFVIAKN